MLTPSTACSTTALATRCTRSAIDFAPDVTRCTLVFGFARLRGAARFFPALLRAGEALRAELFLEVLLRDALFRDPPARLRDELFRDADAALRPVLFRPRVFRPDRAPVDLFFPPFEPLRVFFLAAAMISAPIKKLSASTPALL